MTIAEFWKERYDAVVAEKQILVADRKELKAEIEELRQQIDDLKDSGLTYAALKNMETEKKDLQTRLNNSRASNEAYRSMNSYLSRKLSSSMHQAQELKMQLEVEKEENESLHNVIDSFVDKCKELEDKAEGYKKKLEFLNTVVTPDLDAQLKSMTERLNKSIADRSELQADRDFWVHDSAEKTVEIQSLKSKVESLEADLKSETCSRDTWRTEAERLRKEITESYSDGYSDGNEEGQNELWEMLQMINDVKPFEAPYFEDVTSMNDIISWDLEDFKEAYDKWEAEKKKAAEEAKKQHVDYMRDYLKRYCVGKLCFGCPLYNASEPVSSCLFSKLTDEEVEKRYRKVIESERKVRATDDTCSGVHEKVKEACDAFAEGLKAGLASEVKEVPVSCDIPIKGLASWECTIDATVEINKDLLKDICGIKPKEEEHKFEYGDAVRLPWCNYDYMYIAPDEKEKTLVRLFDPNIHAIVTTHISNVRYNGGRILVSEEDDIRKIWKYMK